jgi:hypothetical protein
VGFRFAFKSGVLASADDRCEALLPRFASGRLGLCQLLLRSQGPRGPIAIACPVLTSNQSLRFARFGVFFLHSVVTVGRLGGFGATRKKCDPLIAAAASCLGNGGKPKSFASAPFCVLRFAAPTASRSLIGRVFRNGNRHWTERGTRIILET